MSFFGADKTEITFKNPLIIQMIGDSNLNNKLDKIMATQTQIQAQLEEVLATQKKTSGEITALQGSVDVLNERIAELELVISTGEVKPELTAAVAAVKAQAQLIDEQIPDLPPPPES